MDYQKRSSLKVTLNAKDSDQPKIRSPTLTAVKRSSPCKKNRSILMTYCETEPLSKSMQMIVNRRQQRVEEVQAFLTPGSPQLKSSDSEQPRKGDLSLKRNRSVNNQNQDFIKIEINSSPLKFELKSKLYERRVKK